MDGFFALGRCGIVSENIACMPKPDKGKKKKAKYVPKKYKKKKGGGVYDMESDKKKKGRRR